MASNGQEDIWWILEGRDYPRFAWEWGQARLSYPQDGVVGVTQPLVLCWRPGGPTFQHDVYFGEDKDTVANATIETLGIYRGRQPDEITTYDPGILPWGKTYYWRIDEVDEFDPNGPWKGAVWTFTTADCIISPGPANGASDVAGSTVLSWVPGGPGLQYDVYLGESEADVADATPQNPGIYRDRQPSNMTAYEPGILKLNTTYYWRIDGVRESDPQSPWKGRVWTFTTGDFLAVVDDFEGYTDDMEAGEAVFQTWIDGWSYTSDPNDPNDAPSYVGNGTGSLVGNMIAPFAEWDIVHGGRQSMPMDYNNVDEPWYSETERTWGTTQDWTVGGADTLTLYFRGEQDNSPEPLYVAIEDSAGQMAMLVHPDPNAVLATDWQRWDITLGDVQAAGVDVAAVTKMVIGVGDRDNPQPGRTGRIYIDDVRLTKRKL